jgi:hypothetical protein
VVSEEGTEMHGDRGWVAKAVFHSFGMLEGIGLLLEEVVDTVDELWAAGGSHALWTPVQGEIA